VVVSRLIKNVERQAKIDDCHDRVQPTEGLAKKLPSVNIRQVGLDESEKFTVHWFDY